MSDSKHIHLIGICGTAMASLAGMLKQRGFRVTGSDAAAYPPMSDFLASLDIPVAQPFATANLEPRPEHVLMGNTLEHILDQRIPFCSLPQILHEEFLRGKEVLVVAGTHGKTTTTSMLAWIFHSAGLQPSFLIGGIAENFGSSFRLGQGKSFILEGDEYDTAFFDKGPKFLHYFPDAIILTSVEFDHADIYKDLDAVETAFKRLVNLVPGRGRIVALDTGESIERCLAKGFCPVERYGSTQSAAWRITNLRLDPAGTSWSVLRDGEAWCDFEFALAGEYNVLNATAAAALAAGCGISKEQIAAALKRFKSVKRRLEVWAILEPRSNTLRRNVFQNELARSLAVADEIVVANVFKSESIPERERMDVAALAADLQKQGRCARIVPDADAIVQTVAPEMRPGDVVAILSNGGFGGIYEKLPQRLKSLAGGATGNHPLKASAKA
jgi:UDP-N-acetylmuramate: L-alanyl-gamma-D-glutamyl-meso-diaminopimelate ligase